MCPDKYKQASRVYDNKGKEKTSSTSKNKKNHGIFMFVSMNVENYSAL